MRHQIENLLVNDSQMEVFVFEPEGAGPLIKNVGWSRVKAMTFRTLKLHFVRIVKILF